MKIYVDCVLLGDAPYGRQRDFIKRLVCLDEEFEKVGIEVLRLVDNGRNGRVTADLVLEAECVVTLCDFPSGGFGTIVREVLKIRPKPAFAFMQTDCDWNVFEFVEGVTQIHTYQELSDIPGLVLKLMNAVAA